MVVSRGGGVVDAPTPFRDLDLAYLDAADLSADAEAHVLERLRAAEPGIPWEATNQARVHLWYRDDFGRDADPITSIEDAVSRFPETCTAVGLTVRHDEVRVIAPLGLDDLFAGILRRNPRQTTREQFRKRTAEKRILQTWPGVAMAET